MLIIDGARDDEIAEVLRLARDSLADLDLQAMAMAIEEDSLVVARDERSRHVLGFALSTQEPACDAHLLALAVDGDHRGQGVGSALLRGAQDQMIRHGARRMVLEVRIDNLSAQEFYARHGYAPEGLHAHAYPDGADAVCLSRPL